MHIAHARVTAIEIKKAIPMKEKYGAKDSETITIKIESKHGDIEIALFSDPGEKIKLNLP